MGPVRAVVSVGDAEDELGDLRAQPEDVVAEEDHRDRSEGGELLQLSGVLFGLSPVLFAADGEFFLDEFFQVFVVCHLPTRA